MNISTQIQDLPECIYYSFRDYLTQDDYQQLLNTSKKLFFIRRKTIIYHLTRKYSIKYCEDENFRSQLLEKVENPFKQIIIKLKYSDIKSHEDLFERFPVHVICLYFEESDSNISLRDVKEFNLIQTPDNINTFSDINQCEKANLFYCQGITDISLLKDCKELTLDRCVKITDFSCLGKQKSLSIMYNAHLTNVMNFSSIRTLVLRDCRNLKDVSPLHGVHDLSLIECPHVSDISSLGGHHRFQVSDCGFEVSGYHVLKNIPRVKLSECDVSDVSVLSKAKVVALERCHLLVDVSPLRRVRELTLRDCSKIKNISTLATVQKLTLYNLPKLENYEGVNQMTKNLSLPVNTRHNEMLEIFPNAKAIECSGFEFDRILPLLPSFTNLHSLTIAFASPIRIEVSLDIHTVIIEHSEVANIRGLGKNRVVRLRVCRGDVLDVSNLSTVPFVSIICCRFKEVNYESLMNVPRLKIDW